MLLGLTRCLYLCIYHYFSMDVLFQLIFDAANTAVDNDDNVNIATITKR